ncbi:polyprenyl synthetase family protein [Rhodosalinus sp.]|uniref:polyprenyl synthetase family protein n=1 Tax=Rhodosalinus sp. TaxID=2047741 RepID=UPI003567CC35
MPRHTSAVLDQIDERMIDLCGAGPVGAGAQYHLSTGGSRVRARLGLEAAGALALAPGAAEACAVGPELLHNASLVHDDLQDHDATRRGHPAVWRRFGPAAAVCVGDVMISAAFAAMASHPDPARAIGLMHAAIARTANGQARDLRKPCLDLDAYRALVAEKTGTLIALPVRLALAAANAPGDSLALEVGDTLAFAYQAIDDIRDRDADRASGRVNLCTRLGTGDKGVSLARSAARDALHAARHRAAGLPGQTGASFCNLADRMDSKLTEHANAA